MLLWLLLHYFVCHASFCVNVLKEVSHGFITKDQ